jgi:hypothetical protein
MGGNGGVLLRTMFGLGDKLLDVIGCYVLCKLLHYDLVIDFNSIKGDFVWGNNIYDLKLLKFNNIDTNYEQYIKYQMHTGNGGVSYCPYFVYIYVKQFIPDITFETVSSYYIKYGPEIIQPSEIIVNNIPEGLNNAYGVHMRNTDKIKQNPGIHHECSFEEYQILEVNLLNKLYDIILTDSTPVFLIVSENNTKKIEIIDKLQEFSKNNNKNIKFIDIDYTITEVYNNYNAVLDMFCLSKCKTIIQSVKYSSYSIVASIIGNNNIINFSNKLVHYNKCMTHIWSSIVKFSFNDFNFNFDTNIHIYNLMPFNIFRTNIKGINIPQSKKLQIFVVFHNKLFDGCYEQIPADILKEYFTFIAVNERYKKEYTPNKYKIINEWELPIYNPYMQQQGYNENSAIYHIYANNLHKEYDQIGFLQYDMILNGDIITKILQSPIEHHLLFRDSFEDCTKVYKNDKDYETIEFIVKDYEKFFNTMFEKKESACCNYNSYIIPIRIFEKIMPWIIQLYDKMYPRFCGPPYSVRCHRFGHIGEIFERAMAMSIYQEDLPNELLSVQHRQELKMYCY